MTRQTCAIVISFGLMAAAVGALATAADEKKVDAKSAFARLKSLDGTWKVVAKMGEHGPDKPESFTYRVTSNGSVVMET
ncbi:MAG TPA: hypothetical protein VGH33_15855, partial [Isosphaeraceae bacterium]